MKRIIMSILADMKYIIDNQRELGFSIHNLKADLDYMVENLVDPLREKV